ncbi:Uncharacterised protein [Vibrio cholerae]|uniref:Uncharacterized protein n=1 Tax=Vibrio cholerae TaxID=666 RepID=A0A655PJV6_VIBCL|nr:Uncharacterised protein [Vibrio cholerae]CSA16272.1 Uncharacterised protein [Vibrio cholerae]CSA72925.1 Uncharacterised protein [Vibrio cholerae]
MVAPAPGSTPVKKPRIEERSETGAASLTSSLVSFMLPMFFICSCSLALLSASGFKMPIKVSPRAKVAIAKSRKLKPSIKSVRPKVKRSTPIPLSIPTVESIKPSTVIIHALMTWPLPAKAATAERPTSMSAK